MGRLKARLASRNANKLRELAAALPGWDLDLVAAEGYPEESEVSYVENARAKARFARPLAPADAWVMGEDSGLEVVGLGGGPGVRSARFAGPGEDPVARLLAELAHVEDEGRRARYVCELVAIAPGGREFRATGVLSGSIGRKPRGSEGFGYDPVFVPEGHDRTVAELGNAWKRAHSHRARAARVLLEALGGRASAL